MTDYTRLYEILNQFEAKVWTESVKKITDAALTPERHGDFLMWRAAIEGIPVSQKTDPDLIDGYIKFGSAEQISEDGKKDFIKNLKTFLPWRKGPYSLHDVKIDTEWHSDWKWDRLKGKISSLKGRKILDIGCGNGYHLWRMLLEGADLAFGIDPYILSVMQFNVIEKFSTVQPVFVAPVGVDDIPDNIEAFDSVFSMGLLYHRRDPEEHIQKLFQTTTSGGEVILETLILDSDKDEVFVPQGRYAKMRNVWNLPSPSQIIKWMANTGFKNVKCVDINKTSIDEQRVTEWMQYESLKDYLDPNDLNKTIEGHQAPIRAVFIGEK